MATAREVLATLRSLGDPEIAAHSGRFFKSGPGEYGEGDRFIGLRVPVIRAQVRAHRGLSLRSTLSLLKSPWHEARLFAVLMLVDAFEQGDEVARSRVVTAYLANTRHVNNWDLVDSSAHRILGPWLESRDRSRLYHLALSENLWERRIAIMTTYHFIRARDFTDTLALSEQLLADQHDLIHKAVGWMLREVGNRDREVELAFLDRHAPVMPRTMLRYAIEKFPEPLRKDYLSGRRP